MPAAMSRAAAWAAEAMVGAVLMAVVGLAGARGWRLYSEAILPAARSVPTPTPTPAPDPEADRLRARRQRQVLDHVGAGLALREAGQHDAAIRELRHALALDPGNFEAHQVLREMGLEPTPGTVINTPVPPSPTPMPTFTPRP
jgi:hypothetical protein